MKSTLWLVALLFMVNVPKLQASVSVGPNCNNLVTALKPYVEQGLFQGNVMLAKNGKVLCMYSAGFADEARQIANDHETRFPIASLSKPIIASLALKLQEQGQLDLNATIKTYLPDYDAPWADKVSVHHLLSNRSGLPNHFMLPGWGSGKYQHTEPHDKLLNTIAKMPLSFTPGTQYQYSNLGWLLLGEVIEKATQTSLKMNLVRHVFIPLNMDSSGFVSGASAPLAKEYRWAKNGGWAAQPNMNMQVFQVGAGLFSNAYDLLSFLYVLHQENWLTTSSLKQMFSPDTPYGWRVESLTLGDGHTRSVHSYDGQLKGYSSYVYQVLEDNLSLIVLNNTGMGFQHKKRLADDVLRGFYGLSLPNRVALPSMQLHKSLLDNTWSKTLAKVNTKLLSDLENAMLINDLAQQLEWSGNTAYAIDLYDWLTKSFPTNQALKQTMVRLCRSVMQHDKCSPHDINVGMTVLPLHDESRQAWRSLTPRPILTHVFYPTYDQDVSPLTLGPESLPLFDAGDVVHNGKPVKGGYPLVLMSHGTGGSAPQMLWLASALVKAGYVVAAVNHHGNTAIEPEKYPEGFLLWWERSRDLAKVKEWIEHHDMWRDVANTENIAIVGFSLGGYTTLSALGAITDKARFNAYCERAKDDFSCQAQPEFASVLQAFQQVEHSTQVQQSLARQGDNYRIANVRAAVSIAPAIVHSFEPNSLGSITVPTLLVVGEHDRIAPSEFNARYAHSLLPNSQLHVIDDAIHYSFLSTCTENGKRKLANLCAEPHGRNRQAVHDQAVAEIVSFLQQHVPSR